MPLTEPQEALRPIARERIAKGQLPCERPSRMLGGPGSGQLCSLCDKPIERYQIEFEIEPEGATEQTFRFHTLCHSIWELECASHDSLKENP
jgi:hypothetical protein